MHDRCDQCSMKFAPIRPWSQATMGPGYDAAHTMRLTKIFRAIYICYCCIEITESTYCNDAKPSVILYARVDKLEEEC